MKRMLLLLVLAIPLAACGSSQIQSPGSNVIDYRPHAPKSDVTALAKRRERWANREAAKLLRQLPLPAGAVRLGAPAPQDTMAQSGLGVSTVNMTADRYSLWSVPASARSVLAFEEKHMLPGLRGEGRASSPTGWASEGFDGPRVHGLPQQRAVSVTVEPRGNGSVLRLDAGVSWIYPRSPREVVPAGVREIDIRGGGANLHVTGRGDVARIVRWINALNVSQPGPYVVGCPLILASYVRFSFRSAGGATLARAVAHGGWATNCDTIEFTIRGKQQLPLIDARMGRYAFMSKVQRLLGVRFSDPRSHG